MAGKLEAFPMLLLDEGPPLGFALYSLVTFVGPLLYALKLLDALIDWSPPNQHSYRTVINLLVYVMVLQELRYLIGANLLVAVVIDFAKMLVVYDPVLLDRVNHSIMGAIGWQLHRVEQGFVDPFLRQVFRHPDHRMLVLHYRLLKLGDVRRAGYATMPPQVKIHRATTGREPASRRLSPAPIHRSLDHELHQVRSRSNSKLSVLSMQLPQPVRPVNLDNQPIEVPTVSDFVHAHDDDYPAGYSSDPPMHPPYPETAYHAPSDGQTYPQGYADQVFNDVFTREGSPSFRSKVRNIYDDYFEGSTTQHRAGERFSPRTLMSGVRPVIHVRRNIKRRTS